MRGRRALVAAAGVMLALTACGGSGSGAGSEPPQPRLTSSSVGATGTPSPGSSSSARPTHKRTGAGPAAASKRPPATPDGGRNIQPVTHHASSAPASRSPQPSPAHHSSTTPSADSCSGIAGSTTTIEEETGDKFSPSSVSISRCDFVKAVYDDTTGVPHTWTGPRWDSGQMTANSNSTYKYQFASVGTFHFVCTYHQAAGMTGTVTVT
jgi:plastocyanin